MDRRTGLILTLVSVLLCACPGLTLCTSGFFVSSGSSGESGLILMAAGIAAIASGILMSLIPIVLAVITWRLPEKPAEPITPKDLHEKLPPAI